MNAEFNWWLLIVGLVVGAGMVWLVLADSNRHEADLLQEELPAEAAWIARALADQGDAADPAAVERILLLHRAYLGLPPPDALPTDEEAVAALDPDEPATPSGLGGANDLAGARDPDEARGSERRRRGGSGYDEAGALDPPS